MGRGFAGNGQALGFGLPHEVHSAFDAQVQDVQASAGLPHEVDVALDHACFPLCGHAFQAEFAGDRAVVHVPAAREGKNFGVGIHGKAIASSAFQEVAHQGGRFNGQAVVGKANGPGVEQRVRVCEGFALHFFRRTRDGIHARIRMVCLLRDVTDDFRAVYRRVRIGQAGHGREPPGSSGSASGLDGLFFRKARVAQVDVHIHEPGRDDFARSVDGFRAVDAEAGFNARDAPVLNEQVSCFVAAIGRVKDAPIFD